MAPTYHSITVRWVGLEGLSSEELLQRFTDKQRKRIYPKRVLGLDACGNPLQSLEGLEAYSQLVSLSMARCQLTSLGCTLLSSSLRHLDISGNTLENLQGVEQLYNLTWLDAGHNALQSAAEITHCSQLQVLGLANNHLTSLEGLEGLLSLQSLRVEGNNIKQDLDIRTLAALPNLRHLGLAGNPVMADMDFSQQRAFLVDLMPGLLTLDNQAVCSSVSAHLYSVRESKLGRTHPHQFNEQLLFESSDGAETPVVKIKAAPTFAVPLAAKHQQDLQLPHQLQQQHRRQQHSPSHTAPSTQPHQSQQLPHQLWQQLQQQQAQQLKAKRPTCAPQIKGPQIAFGHKADWDFPTGSTQVDGQLDVLVEGKSAKLNGQNLALLGNTDWGHLRTEVPVNRHVTMEHACQLAHHSSASLPFGNTSERQSTPLKGRPGSAALNPSSIPSPSPKIPGASTGKAGMQVLDCTSSSPHPPILSFGTQLPAGSAPSSPRSLSPNSYLARSGMSKTLPNSGGKGFGSPKLTQPRSSSPLSRPGKPQTLANPSSGQPRSSSPLSRSATAGRLVEQSQGQSTPPGRAAGSTGRASSLAWRAAQEEVQKLDPAKPSFMQSLRTRSLSPESWRAKSKGTAVARPTWQQYERHVTPDRALARPAPVRRVFQGIARTVPGMHDQQGRAFCNELAEAGPSGVNHVPNQAPTVSSKPIKKKRSVKRLESPAQFAGLSPAVKAWSPAGKAPFTARAAPGKPLSPAAKGQSLGLQPFYASASLAVHTQLEGSGARASPPQPQPIRAGQQAIAALLTKQAAWEVTRSASLPPVLSEITAILRCNSESIQTPPARTATELAVAADPQLGQAAWESATAVVSDVSEAQRAPSFDTAAVAATAFEEDAVQKLPDGAKQSLAALSTAEDAVPSQTPSADFVPKPFLSSRSLKSELRVSFAKQIQTDIEAEGQHAQRGSNTPGGNYFLGAGYFQEAGNGMAAEQHAVPTERQGSEIEEAEERLEGQDEEEEEQTAAENLCDAEGAMTDHRGVQSSSSASAADSALQQSGLHSRAPGTEAAPAAAVSLAPTAPSSGSPGGNDPFDSPVQTAVASSLVTEAMITVNTGSPGELCDDINATAAQAEQSSSSVPGADDAHGLDAFLHTVTTADNVLNDLLGELSCSSSLIPAELSRQSSSSMPDQAQAGSPYNGLPAEAFVLGAVRTSLTVAAADAFCSSSSPASVAEVDCSSSAEPGQRSASPCRVSTDVVLDALLGELHTAALARQSSSLALLHSLNSLTEMHRQSSSSPVAESSTSAMFSTRPSSSSLAATLASGPDEYSQHPRPSSSLPVPEAARQGSFRGQSSSSAAQPVVDAEACREEEDRQLSTRHAEAEEGEEWVLEKEEEGWGLKRVKSNGMDLIGMKPAESKVNLAEEEQRSRLQQVDSADDILNALLHDADSETLSAFPSSTSVAASAPDPASFSAAVGIAPAASSSPAAGIGPASSSAAMLGQPPSSTGLGRADSADASLEALLAELSSASATAAAALAPFTSSSAAAAAAPKGPLSRSASSQLVQTGGVAQHGTAQHDAAQHDAAQHGTAKHDAAQHSKVLHDTGFPLSRQLSNSSAFPPKAVTADLTAHNVRQFESSHMTSASAAPSSASLSPQSSSPLLAAAPSAASRSPRASTPLEGSQLGSQFVAKLQGELQQHQEAFNDDLAFIQEVQTRRTLAAGMNPDLELQSLHKRFNNWKFDFKVRMREIEKAMRQMEKDESRSARGLTSPTGRTDSGRTTPMGRVTSPGITPSASGFTTPSGRVTPPGVSGGVAASGRVTPPSTSASGRTTPPSKATLGTSPSGRVTPTGRTAKPKADAANLQGLAMADAAETASTSGRGVSGLTSPAESVTPSGVSFMTDDHAGLSSAFLHESPSAPHAIIEQQQADSSGLSMTGSATAVGLDHASVDSSSGSLATAVPGQLVSSRSSVKDAIAMYEGCHPVSTQLSASRHTAAQQSSSLSGGVSSKLTSSQSSVAYQTKSLSEGVYGKLYSSKSSVSQIATSPSWDQGEEEELITSSIPASGDSRVAGGGLSTSSSGGGVAKGADVTSSGGIGRFGGGIGRGGNNKFAVEGKPADGNAATHAAELDSSSER